MKIYGGDVDPFVASVTHKHSGIKVWNFLIPKITLEYSIVKGCSADLGVNSKIVQIRPTVKAVSTKISKNFFLHICQYFDISERK